MALLLAASAAHAQTGGVGIGTPTPNASAALDITATGRGLLVPRMDSATRATINSPATGLLVFQTDGRAGFWYYNGGWLFLPDKTRSGDNLGNHTATRNLNLGANALVGTGSNVGSTVGVGITAKGGLNLGQNTAGNNVYLGYQAGQANTTGSNNLFSGINSGLNNTTGSNNLFTGYASGYYNTTGNYNQFVGYGSGYYTTTGSYNQFSGVISGYHTTTGSYNQFNGYSSGYLNTTGNYNQFIGFGSGFNNTTGSNNTAVGFQAGPTTAALTNAAAFGYHALVSQNNSLVLGGTGADAVQVGIGTTAPRGTLDVAGPGNTYLVNDPNSGTTDQSVFLPGHLFLAPYSGTSGTAFVQARVPNPTASTTIALQFRTTNNGSLVDALRLNPSGSATFAGNVTANGVTLTSDARFKTQVRPLTDALTAVQRLRGVRYQWNALGIRHGGTAGAEQIGLLAQELEAIYPELVRTDEQGYKSVNYAQLTPVLLEALKELATRNAALETQVQQQQASLGSVEQRLRALEAGSAQAAAH